jgi:hypothetical protein
MHNGLITTADRFLARDRILPGMLGQHTTYGLFFSPQALAMFYSFIVDMLLHYPFPSSVDGNGNQGVGTR